MMTKINTIIISFTVSLVVGLCSILGAPAADLKSVDIAGKYAKETNNERAILEIKQLPGGKVHVSGISFWGTKRENGPNIGELEFTSSLHNGCVKYSEKIGKGKKYNLELTFKDKSLIAKENGISGNFGMNVTFAGEYSKK